MARKRLDFSREEEEVVNELEEEAVRSKKDVADDDEDNEEAEDEGESESHSHLKRPAERDANRSEKESKKPKSDHGGGGGGGEGAAEKKPPPFSRIFSEKDEIVILKGMLKFHGTYDSTGFLKFVKKKLSFDVSKSQLMDKARRLKDKYSNNLKKGKDEADFSSPHDLKLFKLSKKFWGADNNSVMKKPAEDKKVVAGEFSDLYPFLNSSLKANDFFTTLMSKDGANSMESRLVSMEKSKLDALEKEWKNQFLDEARVKLGRVALLQKQVQLLS